MLAFSPLLLLLVVGACSPNPGATDPALDSIRQPTANTPRNSYRTATARLVQSDLLLRADADQLKRDHTALAKAQVEALEGMFEEALAAQAKRDSFVASLRRIQEALAKDPTFPATPTAGGMPSLQQRLFIAAGTAALAGGVELSLQLSTLEKAINALPANAGGAVAMPARVALGDWIRSLSDLQRDRLERLHAIGVYFETAALTELIEDRAVHGWIFLGEVLDGA